MKGYTLTYLQELEILERNIMMHKKESIMTRWFNLFPLDDYSQEKVKSVYNKIVDSYCAPHRYYHTMRHIELMLDKVDEMFNIYHFNEYPSKKFAICCATFFHDIVYNPQYPQKFSDEKLSAELAIKLLKEIGVKSTETLEQIKELILITKTHKIDESLSIHPSMQSIMIDADMSIMATTQEEYLQYAKDIALEYSFIDERDFREGRRKFLHQILSREAIFNTEYMRQLYEEDARRNIRTEVAVLDKMEIDDLLNDITNPEE